MWTHGDPVDPPVPQGSLLFSSPAPKSGSEGLKYPKVLSGLSAPTSVFGALPKGLSEKAQCVQGRNR